MLFGILNVLTVEKESMKPLQAFCQNLPRSYLVDEKQLIFYRKLLKE